MTDNTKLKPQLKYSSTLGCIVESIFTKKETCINIYLDISNVITKIKSSNGITKAICMYILQQCFGKNFEVESDIEGLYEDEVSASYIYKDTNLTDIQKIDDIFSAINNASKEVKQISSNLYNDDEELVSANIFQNGQRYFNIDQSLDSDLLSILNNGDSSKYTKVDQHQLHDAYCSKPLEQKFKSKALSSTRVDILNSISSNKASHLVAYFTKNKNSKQQFVKQREKQ
ncbi:16039_t:CDS:2 [Dentiscutata erythropus]|uniref:16039_t:CDS:1 n=1 Tax=Dentiscutata erythropus TaxID=1348616 RepID=A0A9N9N861_9GLOM|nr:16039_t:CDS:2 [Dentiscutata erythropus]